MSNIIGGIDLTGNRTNTKLSIQFIDLMSKTIAAFLRQGVKILPLAGGFNVSTENGDLIIDKYSKHKTIVGKHSELILLSDKELSTQILVALSELNSPINS